jgi:hypothetical protein
MVWRFYYSCFLGLLHVDEILCMMIFRCEFYEKLISACFKKNEDVASKTLLIYELSAYFIAFRV